MCSFAVNGVLNVLWSPLFFKLRRPDWAFYELLVFWLSILVLIIELARMSSFAAWLLAPYLAWVTFAGLAKLARRPIEQAVWERGCEGSVRQGWK